MTCANDTTPRRLGRIAGLCMTGQAVAAELELSDWSHEPDCPPTVRVMRAALLARRGALDEARDALRPAEGDPLELLTLLTLAVRQGARDAAELMRRLHADASHLPFVRAWLELVNDQPPAAAPDVRVEQLAADLLAHPQAIRTLVAAQHYEPNAARIALLRAAITRTAPDFARIGDLVMVCQALAELALLAGDADDARRWAHRGLKADPYHAPLALVLARVEDDPAVGPPATAVLHRVAERKPAYLDVRAALIRREHRAGDTAAARRRIADWLRRDPSNPLARQMASELLHEPTPRERAA